MDQLLQMLRIKGRATPETLADVLDDDGVAATIERCEAEGLVENTRLGYRITDLGKKRVDELYDDERGKAAAVIDDVYDSFIPINDEIKQIVTDWQMRIVGGQIVLNDHSDPAHDEQVIARLHDTDARAAPALASLVTALPRFDSVCAPAGPGARTHPRGRPHDGGGADQGQLPHRVVRAPRGAPRPLRSPAHGVTRPRPAR